jgi:hypothetical protein
MNRPAEADYERLRYLLSDLLALQIGLLYRTVTVPSDEPLCIATLMSLNMNDIVAIDDEQKRMRKVWELIADKEKKSRLGSSSMWKTHLMSLDGGGPLEVF